MDVTLTWDVHSDTEVAGYEVHYGTNLGGPYQWTYTVNDRETNSITLYSLSDISNYYFVVKAFYDQTKKSDDSSEVCVLNDGTLGSYDRGWEITEGELKGFKILYNEPLNAAADTPTLGPSSDVPILNLSGVNGVGQPLNLQPSPSGDFFSPAKIFIPCPGYADVSGLDIYYYDGFNWGLATDAWMVPGSRVNHNNGNPSTIEIQVYHFSGVQAGASSISSDSSRGGGGSGCFVATAADGI